MQAPYFSQRNTCANLSEREVYLIIPAENVPESDTKILLVDEESAFVNFPGIENPGFIEQYIRLGSLAPFAEFITSFEDFKDGKARVLWEVQPDGWYWADEDGFGAESDYEIVLYSYLDENGNFLAPFRIYRIGNVKYFETDLEEQSAKEYEERQERDRKLAESGETQEESIKKLVDRCAKYFLENEDKVFSPKNKSSYSIWFEVPQSKYDANVTIGKDLLQEGNWRLSVGVLVRGTDMLRSCYLKKDNREGMLENLNSEQMHEEIYQIVIRLMAEFEK